MKIPFINREIKLVEKGAGDSVWPPYMNVYDKEKAKPPKWSYETMYEEAERNWAVQAAVGLKIREAMRPGWKLEFKFKKKCVTCGEEFQKDVDSCPICEGGGEIIKPEPSHMKRARALLGEPNSSRQSWNDIIRSIMYHDLIADKWFLSIAYGTIMKDGEPAGYTPGEIYVEDPRWMRANYDERLRLGKPPYICKHHNDPESKELNSKEPATCPICLNAMQLTAYVQVVGEKVKNRFTIDEIVEGSTNRVLPDPDSLPRLAGAWTSMHIVKAMSEWFYDVWEKAELEYILVFPEMKKQEDLNSMRAAVKIQQETLNQIDAATGDPRKSKKGTHLWLTAPKDVQMLHLMKDPAEMQALEHYLTHVSAILAVYGVQAIYVNAEITGKTGSAPAVKMEIQNHVIEDFQRDKEDSVNKQLFPIFGIEDVVFKFNPLVEKDEHVEAVTENSKADTMQKLRTAGVEFEVDENWRIVPKRVLSKEEMNPQQPRGGGESPDGYKESESTHRLINETTTERDQLSTEEDNRTKKSAVDTVSQVILLRDEGKLSDLDEKKTKLIDKWLKEIEENEPIP